MNDLKLNHIEEDPHCQVEKFGMERIWPGNKRSTKMKESCELQVVQGTQYKKWWNNKMQSDDIRLKKSQKKVVSELVALVW